MGQRTFGSSDLGLPDELRGPLLKHLDDLRARYRARDWAGRVGFGARPALIVIDMARWWLEPGQQIGSNLETVLDGTCRVLAAARAAKVPVFFTTYDYDAADPPNPHHKKFMLKIKPGQEEEFYALHPRLERRPGEKLLRKKYASAFAGTNLLNMLAALSVDTLIVTGVSTSHCVYATCRDAAHTFRVIVPREAVGERCEIMHEVNLLDIEIDLGDVLAADEVIGYLKKLEGSSTRAAAGGGASAG